MFVFVYYSSIIYHFNGYYCQKLPFHFINRFLFFPLQTICFMIYCNLKGAVFMIVRPLDRNFPIAKDINVYSLSSIFQAKYGKNYTFSGEFHPFWEILFVIDGTVFVSGDNKTYKLEKNGIIFHKPMEFHTVSTDNFSTCHVFNVSFFANGRLMKEFENTVTYLDEKSLQFMNYIIDEYKKISNNSFSYWDFFQYTDNQDFMHLTANQLENMLITLKNNLSNIEMYSYDNKDYEIYKKIATYMIDNITKNITNEDIANELCISVSTLKRIFAKFSTMGVHKYFLKLKIAEAAYLLREYSIYDVCEKLGFKDYHYFSYVFKREYGMPPSKYKKKFV